MLTKSFNEMNTLFFTYLKTIVPFGLIGLVLTCIGCDPIPGINKTDVVIIWENPDDIESGIPLGATQLNATASTDGIFKYTPPSGTILEVGNNQVLRVDFTPSDSVSFNKATKTVVINVLKSKSWILSKRVIQWVEPYKAEVFAYPTDIPWNVSFSMNDAGNIKSTVYSGKEYNVTRTHSIVYTNGNIFNGSKTDTWSEPPTEMIPEQEYTIKMKSTRVSGLGNGMSVTGFGSYEEAMAGYVPTFFYQTAFDGDGEKLLKIKLNAPANNEDASKKRVLRVQLSSGAAGAGTENYVNYLYIYEWK